MFPVIILSFFLNDTNKKCLDISDNVQKISLLYKVQHLSSNKILCRKPGCFLTPNPLVDADQKVLIVGSVFIWTIIGTVYRRYSSGNVGNFGCFEHQIVVLIKRVRSTNIYKVSLLRLDHNIYAPKSFNVCKECLKILISKVI